MDDTPGRPTFDAFIFVVGHVPVQLPALQPGQTQRQCVQHALPDFATGSRIVPARGALYTSHDHVAAVSTRRATRDQHRHRRRHWHWHPGSRARTGSLTRAAVWPDLITPAQWGSLRCC